MTHIKSFAVAGILFSCLAQAALPPYYERTRTLGAILEELRVATAVTDPRFARLASGRIDSLRFRGNSTAGDLFEVRTGRCALDVTVKVLPDLDENGQTKPGPGKLEIAVGRSLRCQRSHS